MAIVAAEAHDTFRFFFGYCTTGGVAASGGGTTGHARGEFGGGGGGLAAFDLRTFFRLQSRSYDHPGKKSHIKLLV